MTEPVAEVRKLIGPLQKQNQEKSKSPAEEVRFLPEHTYSDCLRMFRGHLAGACYIQWDNPHLSEGKRQKRKSTERLKEVLMSWAISGGKLLKKENSLYEFVFNTAQTRSTALLPERGGPPDQQDWTHLRELPDLPAWLRSWVLCCSGFCITDAVSLTPREQGQIFLFFYIPL